MLIGHSLGGAVSLMYTGIYPERVRKLVAIEGLGPPPAMLEKLRDRTPEQRMREWIEQVRQLGARQPRRYASFEAAAAAHARGELVPLRRAGASTSRSTA